MILKLALNRRVKKGVYHVESYMIPYAMLKRLRWSTSPAVVGRLDMYRIYVLLYRTMVLMARPTKVRR
jgi:hypothetical protein